MSRSLGSLPLPGGAYWADQYDWGAVGQVAARTLGGTLVTWTVGLSGGRPITIEVADGYYGFSAEDLTTLMAMAAQPGQVFTFTWDSESHQVMFAHHQGQALNFRPIWPHYPLWYGSIKLIEVA